MTIFVKKQKSVLFEAVARAALGGSFGGRGENSNFQIFQMKTRRDQSPI
jgi:hypothetical protein